jgi:hypothetical protein
MENLIEAPRVGEIIQQAHSKISVFTIFVKL